MDRTSCYIFLPLFFTLIIFGTFGQAEKCLTDEENAPPQYTQYNDRQLNLTLATTNRLSQLVITHYLKIYFTEKLGYRDVQIINIDDNFDIEKGLGRPSKIQNVPEWMINIEVWIPPEDDTGLLFENYDVKDCGSIEPPGRMGWFIPKNLLKSFYWKHTSLDIHWTFFTNPKTAAYFDITDTLLLQKHVETADLKLSYNCTECEGGMYIPEQCKAYGSSCAFLLAPYYADTKFIVDHIRQLRLYVKVVWLGKNQQKIYRILSDRYLLTGFNRSLVLLSWTPSEVIDPELNFTSVSFPSCTLMETQGIIGCKYELHRLTKIAWTKLKYAAKSAYDYLHFFSVRREEYEVFFAQAKKYPSLTPEQLACDWMKRNDPEPYGGKLKISIGGIFPLTGNASLSYTGVGIKQAAVMAQRAINENTNILRDYDLQLTTNDGMCKSENVMKSFIDMIHNNYLLGVLGPACSETVEPLAGVTKMFNIITISYSAEGVNFADRTKYPYFFRTIGENQHYNPVFLDMFRALGWNRVASLTEDGQKYTEYISHLRDLLKANNIFMENKKFPREREPDAMKKYLEDLKQDRARIIIVDVADDVARCVMCQAYYLNMTSKQGYVWFLPMWLSSDWFNTTYYNVKKNESVPCTTNMMIEAINGYFSLTHAFYAPDDSLIENQNITVGTWRKDYEQQCAAIGTATSNYGGYAYDAMWTYALALDKLLQVKPEAASTLRSENTALNLVEYIKETDFNGVSGRIKFGNGPSRFSVINIIQWVNQTTHIVGSFEPNVTDDRPEKFHGQLVLNTSAIVWLLGHTPTDGTEPPPICIFETIASVFNIECDIAIIFVNAIGITTLAIILTLIALYIVKRKYERKVKEIQIGIDLTTNFMNLDKWEIPRDRVVINRKLGEGQFGTVYGGEAYFPEKGWMGVAVKTLKIGSTTEEKLDFLSEAEIMKRFDHKNIVKLVGVCTQNEPVYTVMEFMLYGDLKTFLLARRHLVNDRFFEENDEISSKKLTSMALDVARALSYLAEMKFVHRDVACRNCLLNAQRMVKLGDFGMTRPMFENDYYKFNRKGMLPVRWMAPESLGLGVFTPSSDVWSFGVLLYEIITFGSFPFQGMSNYQVLEHVKEGNILTIPQGVKPQLEALIKSCWNLDHKRRPHSSQIVEFLANTPRLLSPCLDVPLSSVYMEDTTSELDIGLPELFRKCSVDPHLKAQPNGMPPGHDANLPLIAPFAFSRQQSISSAIISETGSVFGNDVETIPLEYNYAKEPLLGSVCAPQFRTENDLNKCKPSRRQVSESEYIPLERGLNAEVVSIL